MKERKKGKRNISGDESLDIENEMFNLQHLFRGICLRFAIIFETMVSCFGTLVSLPLSLLVAQILSGVSYLKRSVFTHTVVLFYASQVLSPTTSTICFLLAGVLLRDSTPPPTD